MGDGRQPVIQAPFRAPWIAADSTPATTTAMSAGTPSPFMRKPRRRRCVPGSGEVPRAEEWVSCGSGPVRPAGSPWDPPAARSWTLGCCLAIVSPGSSRSVPRHQLDAAGAASKYSTSGAPHRVHAHRSTQAHRAISTAPTPRHRIHHTAPPRHLDHACGPHQPHPRHPDPRRPHHAGPIAQAPAMPDIRTGIRHHRSRSGSPPRFPGTPPNPDFRGVPTAGRATGC